MGPLAGTMNEQGTTNATSGVNRVGIGTTTPSYKLDVVGDVSAQNYRINAQPVLGLTDLGNSVVNSSLTTTG